MADIELSTRTKKAANRDEPESVHPEHNAPVPPVDAAGSLAHTASVPGGDSRPTVVSRFREFWRVFVSGAIPPQGDPRDFVGKSIYPVAVSRGFLRRAFLVY